MSLTSWLSRTPTDNPSFSVNSVSVFRNTPVLSTETQSMRSWHELTPLTHGFSDTICELTSDESRAKYPAVHVVRPPNSSPLTRNSTVSWLYLMSFVREL